MTRRSTFALTGGGPIKVYGTSELITLPPPTWLIKDVLPAGGLVGLYGEPGCGKSFLAIDMALCVGGGLDWHGFPVSKGFVLYISAEGGTGIGKRAAAWLSHYAVDPKTAHVGWITEAIPIHSDSEDMDVLFRRLHEEVQEQPVFIIVDTLARCFGDGDENAQEDMGRFIAGVDRLRREFNATVIVVHHTRLGADRERGSTAFRGAADTMLVVTRKKGSDVLHLTCNKQKDAEEFEEQTYILKEIQVSSLLKSLVLTDDRVHRGEIAKDLLRIIKNYGPMTFTAVSTQGQKIMSQTSVKKGLSVLEENGEIIKENRLWRVV